jgi:hypothetical protein
VAVSTHKQALHAVISLYKEVLKQDLDLKADAVRAKKNHIILLFWRCLILFYLEVPSLSSTIY